MTESKRKNASHPEHKSTGADRQTAGDITRTAAWLKAQCPLRPELAFVLGTGFAAVTGELQVERNLPFGRLPGFPQPGVRGHAGELLVGRMAGVAVLVLNGRAHYYEGHPMERITFPIRVLAAFGIRHLVLTNAAGGINPRFRAGEFMVVTDHINFMGTNPLRGAPGTRAVLPPFVDLSRTYDRRLSACLRQAARRAGAGVHSGVYLAVEGPSYETPAEVRAFARWGADAVGMSTVPEAIVARHCCMNVAGLCCIANRAAARNGPVLAHSEVLAAMQQAGPMAARVLKEFVVAGRNVLWRPEGK